MVWGTGSIGSRHLVVLRENLALDPAAMPVRSSQADKLRADGLRVVTTPSEGAGLQPELVIVATDTCRHVGDALAAIEMGANVLVEKPLSHDLKGVRELNRAAGEHHRQIFVACNLRFETGLSIFRQRLPEIGKVHAVRIECQSYLPEWRPNRDYRQMYCARREDGGVMRDLVHEIDYATWIFGRPTAVTALLQNTGRLGIEADEAADLMWQVPDGPIVTVRLDYLSRVARRRMRAFGEAGELEWDLMARRVALCRPAQPEQIETFAQERNDMMAEQLRACFDAIDGRSSGNLATFDDGAFAVALMLAARQSSDEQRAISIPDWRTS